MKNTLLLLCMLISANSFSEEIKKLNATQVNIEKQNEKLIVSFIIKIPQYMADNNSKEYLIPVVYNGKDEVYFPVIQIKKKNRFYPHGSSGLSNNKTEQTGDSIVSFDDETIVYSEAVPYEAWMYTISLRIDRKEDLLHMEKILSSEQLIENLSMLPALQSISTEEILANESSELPDSKQQFVIYFPFNQANIDTTSLKNSRIFQEIVSFMKKRNIQGNITKSKIEISGYASPEGDKVWNEQLAFKRAKAIQDYLVKEGLTDQDTVVIVNYVVNWNELRNLVNASDLPRKKEVLEILNSSTNEKIVNQKLQQLQTGIPYHYLTTQIYPQLRTASFLVKDPRQ